MRTRKSLTKNDSTHKAGNDVPSETIMEIIRSPVKRKLDSTLASVDGKLIEYFLLIKMLLDSFYPTLNLSDFNSSRTKAIL